LGISALAFALISTSNPASANTATDCSTNQESFGFFLKDYPMEHQGNGLLNISVLYRLNTAVDKIEPDLYPEYVGIVEKIQKFLEEYPNESDYWEIINKKMAGYLLEQYPSMSSVHIKIDVAPTTPRTRYERFSEVLKTRPDNCPLITVT